MQNNYLTDKQITKLKEGLMNKKHKHDKNSNFSSSEYYKMKNNDVGIYFEENIRNILMVNYGWKKKKINRKILYCYIKYDDESHIITDIKKTKLNISKKEVIFNINKDKSLDIIIDKISEKIKTQKETKKIIGEKECTITERKDMENDGWFELNNFDINSFDKNEVKVIYKNIQPKEIKNTKQAIIESKLSKNKINELLLQLARDKSVIKKMENFERDSILYIGFINS